MWEGSEQRFTNAYKNWQLSTSSTQGVRFRLPSWGVGFVPLGSLSASLLFFLLAWERVCKVPVPLLGRLWSSYSSCNYLYPLSEAWMLGGLLCGSPFNNTPSVRAITWEKPTIIYVDLSILKKKLQRDSYLPSYHLPLAAWMLAGSDLPATILPLRAGTITRGRLLRLITAGAGHSFTLHSSSASWGLDVVRRLVPVWVAFKQYYH